MELSSNGSTQNQKTNPYFMYFNNKTNNTHKINDANNSNKTISLDSNAELCLTSKEQPLVLDIIHKYKDIVYYFIILLLVIGIILYWSISCLHRISRRTELLYHSHVDRFQQLQTKLKHIETIWHEQMLKREQELEKIHMNNIELSKVIDKLTDELKKC